MFCLSRGPIKPLDLSHHCAGAFVTFEGKVRNRNEGRNVIRLDYEAFEPLAVKEGQQILDEAKSMFALELATAVHRLGTLEVGETAVWIGVAAGHREKAFQACEWIIEELKRRVPIWKREHYSDGDPIWVGCAPQDGTFATLREFYDRQIRVPEVGAEGQEMLARSHVLVVGAGGLGSATLPYLAGAGIGKITVCDDDSVETCNLHRQVMFRSSDLGRNKADLAAKELRGLNPHIVVEAVEDRLSRSNVMDLIAGCDVVIDGTDNFATKFLLNEACLRAGVPLVLASLHRFDGQMLSVRPGSGAGCLRCVWPEEPYDGCVGTCGEEGIIGAVAGVFGCLQAMEAIKLILDIPDTLDEHILIFDLRSYTSRRLKRAALPACPVCGSGGNDKVVDIDLSALRNLPMAAIDIREADEWRVPLGIDVHCRISASDIEGLRKISSQHERVLLVCKTGARSAMAARRLRALGIEAYSLRGGAVSMNRRGNH